MPPEAMEKSVFSPAGDVWSYGITLWEMFSFGQQPWARFSLQQVCRMAWFQLQLLKQNSALQT